MKVLMTADAVGGVWTYATELAAALEGEGVEVVIAVMGPSVPLPLGGEGKRAKRSAGEGTEEICIHADGHDLARRPLSPTLSPEGEREKARCPLTIVHTDLALDWLASRPEPVIAAAEAIRTLAHEVGADVIHLNSPALAGAARFDLPVVAVAHGCVATWWEAAHGTAPPPSYAWHERMMREGLEAADAVIAPSSSYAAIIQRRYGLANRPIAIHNGRTPLALPNGVAQADFVFTAGRLWDAVKRTPLLDAVAARLSVPFRAAGPTSAPHGEHVTAAHLQLLGILPEIDLAHELAHRPVFVSAASFEPFGLAVLEAAQAGCALVLSDIATFRELWDDAAVFVTGDDPVIWADTIDLLMADPARRATLGQSARERAGRYTPAKAADAMAAIYRQLAPALRQAAA